MEDQQRTSHFENVETGRRRPTGHVYHFLLFVPLLWSAWQLWYASSLPLLMGFSWLNEDIAKYVHLAFAIFLVFLYFPARKKSVVEKVPPLDWLLAFTALGTLLYLIIFREDIVERLGAPTTTDVFVGSAGILLLLEATRRALGPPLMIVAIVFMGYCFFGPYMPDVIAHKGASLNKLLSHQWFTSEGIFGVAIGVSTTFVFLFVLFGALLEKAGAGNYFIQVAFSLMGHMRGGPAKAAVVASGLSGIVSGSSIANVVTTGTFTIPLMKRVGFSASKAGAVEVAASTNGQLTPPIMGAAAFLMVEYVGISYVEVIRHALLPALISYIALIYIVHLEALKANMQPIKRTHKPTAMRSLISFLGSFIGISVLTALVYYGIGWSKYYLGDASIYVISLSALIIYVALVKYAAKYPDLEHTPEHQSIEIIPPIGPTLKSGLYFLLPIVLLVWCLTVERWSPGTSAFWASLFMILITLTHKSLLAFFRQASSWRQDFFQGGKDVRDGFINGGRNMIGIGVATAAAGIIVGSVTLTGIGLVMTEFVEFISGGNILLMLAFTAFISLILGMGLPTTANYIVVSTLMAPVIVTLGAQSGLIVPLIAVHLFVFYFGILADDTPPVGLAAFAAAAIAQSDPIKTGIQGFTYDIRTAILPFMFIFNTQLLLIDIPSVWSLILTVLGATTAILVFAAATQGYWLVKSRWYETLLLLGVAFIMFRPGFLLDKFIAPYEQLPASSIYQEIMLAENNSSIRLIIQGENVEGNFIRKTVVLPIDTNQENAEKRLQSTGLNLLKVGEKIQVDSVAFDSPAEKSGIDFDWEITSLEKPNIRPSKYWGYIPALFLLIALGMAQSRRKENLY